MDTTIDQQVAMDEALAFLVTADIPEIYMQEFYATATVHHHAIRFKMDNKKHIVNLESFRDMLHICPRPPSQSFVKPPFEEEILAFIRYLGHSAAIRKLTDDNINKLYQPWRSFVAIIDKCLTGKGSGYDSLRTPMLYSAAMYQFGGVTYRGPIESGVKHLLGSVVRAMMSPGRSIVASLENVNGFLAMYTPSDDLIGTNFEQKGVVPKVMLHILEEFVLLLGRHSLNNKIPRMVVCKVGKP
nr:hypothetical protein [Tanacetum cinerariifolium]